MMSPRVPSKCATKVSRKSDFPGSGATVLSELKVWSSLNFARSWLSKNFVGRDCRSVAGLLRHCESSDLQVSRLGDADRCHPGEQLLTSLERTKLALSLRLKKCKTFKIFS